jgi:hypothetical protein
MFHRHCYRAVAAALLLVVIPAQKNLASAAESNAIPVKAAPVADLPLFSVNENYLTYS